MEWAQLVKAQLGVPSEPEVKEWCLTPGASPDVPVAVQKTWVELGRSWWLHHLGGGPV